MSIPEVPRRDPQDAPPAPPAPGPAGGRPLLVALAITCAVLMLATIGFGVGALVLSAVSATAAPEPTPTATASTPEAEPDRVVQGREVSVVSDVEFGYFFMSSTDAQGFTSLYSQIRNDDEKRAFTAFFDVSLYDEDHVLLSRWTNNEYVLPGQTTLFSSVLRENMLGVASISVEQLSLEYAPPITTGTLTLDEVRGGDGGVIEGSFTSSLGAEADFSTVYLIGTVGDEVFAVCWDFWDLPATGGFRARCTLEPTSRDTPEPIGTFPDDAVFTAYYTLDTPL
ncbi:hypothetical protein ACFWHT_01280 [Microbacterium sp. NPDC058342]|uniref:hypothetical protein n=1 Tax=Microbacterium sp. NPDC058342 TaxID=3346454 RepID=UPI00365C373E